ncbi:MAG: four helix bundle protein [Verrucomicrobia bacterium]|nr:four helix bundle protein [Verrucomicrobiota bacterium]
MHKLRICLKELRESQRWLRLICRANLHPPTPALESVIAESDQLIRIFAVSVRTARRNGALANAPQVTHSTRAKSHPET